MTTGWHCASSKRPVFLAAALLAMGVVMASSHAISAVIGKAAFSWTVFFGWLGALQALNALLLLTFWQRRHLFGIGARNCVILWAVSSIFYWSAAPAYYFFSMSPDPKQLAMAACAYFWEVPGVMGGMFTPLCHRLFRPIRTFMEDGKAVPNLATLQRRVLWYPVAVGATLFLLSTIGYTIGAVQLRVFAYMPPIEQVKNVMNGVVVSVYQAVCFFLIFDLFLGQVRSRMEQQFGMDHVPRMRINYKTFGVTLTITLGAGALILLVGMQAFQTVTKEHVVAGLRRDLARIASDLQRAPQPGELRTLLAQLQHGPRGRVALLAEDDTLPPGEFSEETQRFIRSQGSGVIEDMKRDLKVVAFTTTAIPGRTLVAMAYLGDFYGPFHIVAQSFVQAGTFILVLTVGIITLMSMLSTRAIRGMLVAIGRAMKEGSPYTADIHTADEIEELSKAFSHFILRTQRLQRDLEERNMELEELSEELARSNEDLEQFAYVASHDLQEPLRMVGSFTQLLSRRYAGKLDQDADEFIAFAVDGVNRMQGLINDLLEYSRVGTRGHLTPIPAQAALDRALLNLQGTICDTSAVITRDALPSVLGDESQLAQVFQNLFSNAIKYRGERSCRVHVSAVREGRYWRFAVTDQGIGLDMQYAERIFVIFERLHNQTDYPGTGIGLAVCKKIVERHGGRMWVESQPGHGATFYFTLLAGPTQEHAG